MVPQSSVLRTVCLPKTCPPMNPMDSILKVVASFSTSDKVAAPKATYRICFGTAAEKDGTASAPPDASDAASKLFFTAFAKSVLLHTWASR